MRFFNGGGLRGQSYVVYVIWAALLLSLVVSLFNANWSLSFLALATLLMSTLPALFASWFKIHLPVSFFAAIVVFIFGTIFLGEAYDFYERYWWWDIALHGGSAVGFGLVGFVFVFMLFEGDRYAAPPWAIALFGFCFATMIGMVWEIFEFSMDQIFGLNMQKSGLVDTMWDLIVDMAGALFGASAGVAYLKGRSRLGLPGLIKEFISKNRRFFSKSDEN